MVEAAGNKITQKNGDVAVYVCQMKGGTPNGYGTCTYADGGTYVGQFKNGNRNGNGKFTFNNSDKYVGQFKDHGMHGYGTFTLANGTIKYTGEWENNEPKKIDEPKNVS